MQKQKLLIISVSAGSGHISAAKALLEETNQHFPYIQAKHVDLLELISGRAKSIVENSYESIAKYFPEVWGAMYNKSNRPAASKAFSEMTKLLQMIKAKKLEAYIQDFAPDRIITTHFLPAHLLSHLKSIDLQTIPMDVVLTDYGSHALWYHPEVCTYYVASEQTKSELQAIDPEIDCKVSGIPIRSAFYQSSSNNLKLELKLGRRKTILFLAGGQGLIPLERYVSYTLKSLDTPTNIIAVAGKNKKLYRSLQKIDSGKHNFHAFGWTDNMYTLMRLSDCVVSKPGGITTSECITLKKPLIAIEPIPGQEMDNAHFLESQNLGTYAHDLHSTLSTLESYLSGKRNYSPLQYKKRPSQAIIAKK